MAEQGFYGGHCLCGTGGCFLSICEMALQLLQWHLPPMGKHVFGKDESSPQLRPNTGDRSGWVVPASEAGEGAVGREA